MRALLLSDLHLGSPCFSGEHKIMQLLDGDYDKIFIIEKIYFIMQR